MLLVSVALVISNLTFAQVLNCERFHSSLKWLGEHVDLNTQDAQPLCYIALGTRKAVSLRSSAPHDDHDGVLILAYSLHMDEGPVDGIDILH